MAQQKLKPTRVKVTIPELLNRTLRIIGSKETGEKRAPLVIPSMLIIESANRFITDPKSFGEQKESLDQALAAFFRLVFDNQARMSAFRASYSEYKKLADEISLKAKVKDKKLRTFCEKDAAQLTLKSVLETLSAKDEDLGIISVGIAGYIKVESGPINSNRTVTASINLIECKDPEEQQSPKNVQVCVDLGPFGNCCVTITNPLYGENSGDEIYVASFGAIFSADGYKIRRSLISSVYKNIGTVSGHISSFPPGVARLPLFDRLTKSPFGSLLGNRTYYAYYSCTVFEYEYSEEERRKALAEAALDATEAVIALLRQDWIGFGINIAELLYDLAIALDGDDCLGSFAFRYDDIGRLPSLSVSNIITFDDTHLLNHYRYDVQTLFAIDAE